MEQNIGGGSLLASWKSYLSTRTGGLVCRRDRATLGKSNRANLVPGTKVWKATAGGTLIWAMSRQIKFQSLDR
jgi:hypothetical protein